MTKKTVNVVKGVAGGAAAGMIMGYLGKNLMGNKNDLKKKASKAASAMGEIADTVAYMFK